MNLHSAFDDVREFHERFGHPIQNAPELLPRQRVTARAAWMREEVDEFCEASTVADQADAMIDLIYFALGTLVEMGVRPERLFDIVHDANMNKLWPGGVHRKREDGKTIKPPAWEDPTAKLVEEIERQRNTAST